MKSQIVLLTVVALLAAAVSTTLHAQELDRLGARSFDLLSPAEHANWKRTSGHWDFDAKTLTGSGESRIDYTRQILTPARITFEMEVIDGVRPRVYFGRYTLAHEGFGERLLGVYPSQDKHKRFRYETGRKYPVVIDITRQHMEVRIDGRVLDSRDVGMDLLPSLGFSTGDSYSKGMTRFSNITIVGVLSSNAPGN